MCRHAGGLWRVCVSWPRNCRWPRFGTHCFLSGMWGIPQPLQGHRCFKNRVGIRRTLPQDNIFEVKGHCTTVVHSSEVGFTVLWYFCVWTSCGHLQRLPRMTMTSTWTRPCCSCMSQMSCPSPSCLLSMCERTIRNHAWRRSPVSMLWQRKTSSAGSAVARETLTGHSCG